ncbi:hypothetical protein N9743_01415 [Flavobacteriaceae bacterium]|nr:hypothetical protein [Flavobacteriaceae bacterium]
MKKLIFLLLFVPIVSFGQRVTYKSAYAFMKKRSNNINQKLLKGYSMNFDGTKTYLFFTVPWGENGIGCVSMISEKKLEVFVVDCKSFSTKESQWRDIGGPDLYPSDIDIEDKKKLDKTLKERDRKMINEFLSNQSDKDLLEKYNQSQYVLKKIQFKNTDYYTSFLKVSEVYRKKYEDQSDENIKIKLFKKINNVDIRSLPEFREIINKEVFSVDNKNRYLEELESGIKSFNDSLLVVFSSALENKNKELISSIIDDLVEYEYKAELNNRVREKFDLNRTLSITSAERFKNYFVNFSVNTFPFFTVYNENATINFEIIDGKIKSSTGHTLDYTFSDDEKIILEPFLFFKISPKLESFTIKKNVKLVTLNKIYIHEKKDSKTLFMDKQTLNQEEKTTFRGGKWKPKLIFSKDRFSNSEPIKTRSIESLRNLIKLNINETFGFKVSGQPGKFKVSIVEDMKTYFNNSISQNTLEGYFSKNKKIVNVYTEWVYELYINDKKINETVKTKFKKSSPFSSTTKPINFNKPFYTVDVFEVF